MQFAFRITSTQERLIAELSALEMQVMQLLWAQGPRNVRQLHALLAGRHAVDYPTVMAAVSKLVRAGLLSPEAPQSGISYSYEPTLSREQFFSLCGQQLGERAVGQ